MLQDWIRNIPVSELRKIVGDAKVHGSRIWHLAAHELMAREQVALAA